VPRFGTIRKELLVGRNNAQHISTRKAVSNILVMEKLMDADILIIVFLIFNTLSFSTLEVFHNDGKIVLFNVVKCVRPEISDMLFN